MVLFFRAVTVVFFWGLGFNLLWAQAKGDEIARKQQINSLKKELLVAHPEWLARQVVSDPSKMSTSEINDAFESEITKLDYSVKKEDLVKKAQIYEQWSVILLKRSQEFVAVNKNETFSEESSRQVDLNKIFEQKSLEKQRIAEDIWLSFSENPSVKNVLSKENSKDLTQSNPNICNATDIKTQNGVFYTVQLGVLSQPALITSPFCNLSPLFYEILPNGMYKYYAGQKKQNTDAEFLKKELIEKGFEGIFVTKINDASYRTATLPKLKDAQSDVLTEEIPYATAIKSIKESFYTVQVGAFSKPLQNNAILDYKPLYYDKINGLYKYFTGKFISHDEAEIFKNKLKEQGQDAFVTKITHQKIGEQTQVNKDISIQKNAAKLNKQTGTPTSDKEIPLKSTAAGDVFSRLNALSLPEKEPKNEKFQAVDLYDVSDAFYTVQFFLTSESTPLTDRKLLSFRPLYFVNEMSKVKYYVGKTTNLEEAKKIYFLLKNDLGITDAIIYSYDGIELKKEN